jgi:hypothetical protein
MAPAFVRETTGAVYEKLMTLSTDHFYYAARLVAALLIATLVPLLLDRRSRH